MSHIIEICISNNFLSHPHYNTKIEILLLGVILRKSSSSGTGMYTERILKNFSYSKFGKRGFEKTCGLEDVEQAFTDSAFLTTWLKLLRNGN